MANPLAVLGSRFSDALVRALGPEGEGVDPVLRRAQQAKFGDFQANFAMGLAKRTGRVPRELAAEVVAAVDLDDLAEKVEVAGPGFVNIWLRPAALAAMLGDPRQVEPPAVAEKVVIDYSHPNVAKEMRVHHLRSTILGDALARVYEFLGHTVVRHNHIGDWGTNFGMLIEHTVDLGESEAVHEMSVGDLDAFYRAANAKFESDPAFAERARARVVMLQSGDETTLRLWRVLVRSSTEAFNAVYRRLGVTLTDADVVGESFYNPWLPEVAAELEASGLAVVDDGALCVFPEGFVGRDGEPLPLIVRKRDGGFGYQATDLAAIRYRWRELGATRILYVVDAGQTQHHLPMVIAVAEAAGWVGPGGATLVPFGFVLGAEGGRFRTRTGETLRLSDLLDEAVERAAAVVAEKSHGLPDEERASVARAVGIGAIKYADLANDRVKDYKFDWGRMLAMDGNTAPYLQYAHARVRSIFRRGEAEGGVAADASTPVVITEDAERALVLELLGFDTAVRSVVEHLQPHRLCQYLFDLAQAFTGFYETCPVLGAPSPDLRASRLRICELTASTLQTGLDLLGIEAPSRM